jgi:hypothetical protein
MLPRNAKLYIALVIATGCALLLFAAYSWSSEHFSQFALYLGLAAVASTLKIRIPGFESTVTPNFAFLLLALHACSLAQVVVIAAVMAIVQCIWRSATRPRLVQVAFSAAALIISASVAYQLSHLLLAGRGWDSIAGSVILAGCIYFPLNSVLVAVVIGLVSGKPFGEIWSGCQSLLFPYFMGGIVFTSLVSSASTPSSLWEGAMLLIPAVILAHIYFLNRSAAPNLAAKASD